MTNYILFQYLSMIELFRLLLIIGITPNRKILYYSFSYQVNLNNTYIRGPDFLFDTY
jgi:hypothetical protein